MEQDRIWDHFQTARVDSFDQARGRYAAMAAEARRRRGGDGGRVLNIGIGAGGVERLLLARGWRVASLDPSETAVAALVPLGIDARRGYAQGMSFDDASFDVVVASEVLEHIEPATRAEVLAEVARVLVPGGWFIGSVPYREVLGDQEVICPDCGKVFHRWGHVSSFDVPLLQAELARVFEAVSCRRRSFVDWTAARAPLPFVKALAKSMLGRLGEPIANPSILFAARRRGGL
ncbi:MAG: class I SAM-dependent methyltransferase [Betaproteobacteria bacterium]|nr:class I SAM-dependent methyltransferase [Betaproteobacteria bacterium]